MDGPECPKLGEAFKIRRKNGNDEWGLAKEAVEYKSTLLF